MKYDTRWLVRFSAKYFAKCSIKQPLWNLFAEYFSFYGVSEQFQGPRSDFVPAHKGKKKMKGRLGTAMSSRSHSDRFLPPKFTTKSISPQLLLSRRMCQTKAVRESNICPAFSDNAAIKHRRQAYSRSFTSARRKSVTTERPLARGRDWVLVETWSPAESGQMANVSHWGASCGQMSQDIVHLDQSRQR